MTRRRIFTIIRCAAIITAAAGGLFIWRQNNSLDRERDRLLRQWLPSILAASDEDIFRAHAVQSTSEVVGEEEWAPMRRAIAKVPGGHSFFYKSPATISTSCNVPGMFFGVYVPVSIKDGRFPGLLRYATALS